MLLVGLPSTEAWHAYALLSVCVAQCEAGVAQQRFHQAHLRTKTGPCSGTGPPIWSAHGGPCRRRSTFERAPKATASRGAR